MRAFLQLSPDIFVALIVGYQRGLSELLLKVILA